MISSIKLLDHQTKHVDELLKIFSKRFCAIDTSKMGCGKTYTALYIAKKLNLHIVVVCPPSIEENWRNLSEKYGVNSQIVSYHTLRSRSNNNPRFLLNREDSETTVFTLKEEFENFCRNNSVLLILDEFQYVKNDSDQFLACEAIVKSMKKYSRCRVLLISGTPIDKEQQCINVLKLMGILDKNISSVSTDRGKKYLGWEQIRDYCLALDFDTTNEILKNCVTISNKKKIIEASYKLFIAVILKYHSSFMISSVKNMLTIRNVFYKCSELEYEDYVKVLQKYPIIKDEDGDYRFYDENISVVVKFLEALEWVKKEIIYRQVKKALKETNKSIVIGVHYYCVIEWLTYKLREFNPIVITGSVTKNNRSKLLKAFNDIESRLLIVNVDCMCTGVEMDDKTGDNPREVFIVADHKIQNLHQFNGRFNREGTKSETVINYVYIKNITDKDELNNELNILRCIERKSKVLREGCGDKGNFDIIYPSEYSVVYE